jgi:type I restriction enzyme S subunit
MVKQVSIGKVFEFVRNGASIKQEDNKSGYPITRIETIWNETIDDNRFGYADVFDKELVKYEKYLLEVGDILMTHINSPKHLGKSAMYNGNPEKLLHGMNLLCLRPNKEISVSKYLKHYLNSSYFKELLPKISNQSVNQASFSAGNLKSLEIPLPPLPQQQKIANILDAADAVRQNDKALLAKYDELIQALFLDMFGDPVSNSKGWEKVELGNITDLITDGKHGNCNDEPNSGYYFISAKDIFDDNINYNRVREIPKSEFEEVDRRTNLQAGDLVMVNTGATIGKLAIAKDIPETRRTTFQKSVAVIKVKREKIDTVFLKYVFILRLESFSGKGSGSAIQNLLLSEMRRFKIIIPPLELQNQFAERVAVIEEQKAIAQKSLEQSESLFNSLLQKAFKGELV